MSTTTAPTSAPDADELTARRPRAIDEGPHEKGAKNYEVGPEVDDEGKLTPAGWRWLGRELRREMPYKSYRGKGSREMHYITARQVQARLDAVVGPGHWETRMRVIRTEPPVAVQVGIGIMGVWKWDIGYSNNPDQTDEFIESVNTSTGEVQSRRNPNIEDEPLKAAASDGLKRAAVQWGIGRFLYPDVEPDRASRRNT